MHTTVMMKTSAVNEVTSAWDNIRQPAALILDACKTYPMSKHPVHDRIIYEAATPLPPLILPSLPCFKSQLESLCLPSTVQAKVEGILMETLSSIDVALQESYCRHLPLMVAWADPQASQSRSMEDYAQALQNMLWELRSDSVGKLWSSLMLHLRTLQGAARADGTSYEETQPSSSGSSHPGKISGQGRPCAFTKEQTMVLRDLLAHDDRYSADDKQLIATALNLTREQFCNARARKKPYQKTSSESSPVAFDLSNVSLSGLALPAYYRSVTHTELFAAG
ncbi:hypothetical protein BY996DRAFT_6420305 [Phakopsora pachyrhizi]|nr:hypothetical protein BY996DRAFT_6420305 [Phakopsora pachyrhizi]